ncbi:hypothetical protein KIN20_029529 [Parelaphostrongylus tenuis]|uniref:Uncharacterized protein n=1 Tax=Parelaphostrongylus tenuis TaxID=148309 RepID=A0AAD5WFQ9_PARTN|nr:hypothetical protein KIN20_029529 [Parelaphostrongylus tenuis]
MFDSLAISADVGSGEESDAIMKRNLNTPNGGVEDGGVINGQDDAQQANLNIAPVMGECTTDLRTPTLLTSDESLTGVQGGVVLDCREPVDYELFMRGVWQLIVQQTNIYGKQMDIRWENTNIEGMKQFLALCMQMARAKFLRLKILEHRSNFQ